MTTILHGTTISQAAAPRRVPIPRPAGRQPIARPDWGEHGTALAALGVFVPRLLERDPEVTALVRRTSAALITLNQQEREQRPAVAEQYQAEVERIIAQAGGQGRDARRAERDTLDAHTFITAPVTVDRAAQREIDRRLDAIREAQNVVVCERARVLRDLHEVEVDTLATAGAAKLKDEIARCEHERDRAIEGLARHHRDYQSARDRVQKLEARIAAFSAGGGAHAGELAAATRQLGPAKAKAGIPTTISLPLLKRARCPLWTQWRIAANADPRDREIRALERVQDRAERELRLLYAALLRLRHDAKRVRLDERGYPALYCRRRGCPKTLDREMVFYKDAPPFCSIGCETAHAREQIARARSAAPRPAERVCGGCNRTYTGGPPPIAVCEQFEPGPDDLDYTAHVLTDLCGTECALSVAIDCEPDALPAFAGVAYVTQPGIPAHADTSVPDTADRALALLRSEPGGLRTKQVAERLDVNRTTADSALRQLAQRRLVTGGGRGAGRGSMWRAVKIS